jgi:hypothetical protein
MIKEGRPYTDWAEGTEKHYANSQENFTQAKLKPLTL